MSWEQRLREIVLAGGALAAMGCSNGEATSADGGNADGTTFMIPCCNANGDPCCPYLYCGAPMTPACAAQLDGGGADHSVAQADGSTGVCCNANPDPCCLVLYCGEVSDGNPSCFPQEAGPIDGAADGDGHD